jgi:RHS repeat-associated protein
LRCEAWHIRVHRDLAIGGLSADFSHQREAGAVSYDAVNRVTSAPAGSVNIDNSNYVYDGAGNRLTQSRGADTVTYATNAANQLTQLRKTILAVGTGIGKSTAGQSTFSVDLPAGIRVSDQILVAVSQTDADTVYMPGYSAVKIAVSGPNPTDATTAVYRRTATGNETSVTISASPAAIQSAAVVVYRGVDPVNPVDAVGSAGAVGPSLTYPSVTASMTGERLVAVQGAVNNATPGAWTAPASMTEVVQNTEQSLRSVGIADRALAAAGATGSMSTSIATSGAPAELAGVALTLRPAAPSFSYDGAGDLTGASDGTALAYDAAHRTTAITTAGGTAVTMTYRGAGQSERATISDARRISRDCPEIGGCVPTTTSLGGPATFEHTLLGVTAETDAASTTYYVRDPRGGLLAQRTPTDGTFYYLLDGLGSVTGLTDSTGSRAASYSYDAYGQTTSMTTSSVAVNNPWRYAGAYQDGTGLYKMGARYYDPTLGRFTQQDPLFNPLDPKSWNRYTYAGDDPINFADLTGLEACGSELKFEAASLLAQILSVENGILVVELLVPEAGLIAKAVTWIVRPLSFIDSVRGIVSLFRSVAQSRPC